MKTVAKYLPGMVAAHTDKSIKQVPKGKIWITLVTIEVVEIGQNEMDTDTSFVLFPALPGMEKDKVKANLLRKAARETAGTVNMNSELFSHQ